MFAIAADSKESAGRRLNTPERRLNRRELERQRAQRNKVLIPGAVLGVVLVAAAVVIATRPPPPLPHDLQPGEFVSEADMHIHPHLAIYNGGQLVPIPASIGINPSLWVDHSLDKWSLDGPQMSALHTHEGGDTGIIHVESTVTRGYTLGEFFAVWGQPLGSSKTLGFTADANHRLSMTVDGQPSGVWGNLVFKDGQQIEIHFDTI